MPEAVITRQMPMQMLRASVAAETFDEEARTVEVVWTTGAKGLRRTWDEDYYEELAVDTKSVRMERLNNRAPFLASHRSYGLDSVLGVVERAWLKGGQGHALIRFSSREDVQPIMQDVRDKVLSNISVGYMVHKYERIQAKEEGGIDTLRAVDWEPMEISLVPIGFDDGAKVRSADSAATAENHTVEITTRGVAAPAIEERAMPNDTVPVVETQQQQPAPAPVQAVDSARAIEDAKAAERQRGVEIRAAVKKAGLDAALADTLVAEGIELDAARARIIDAVAERQTANQPATTGYFQVTGGNERFVEGMSNWLIEKAGVRSIVDPKGTQNIDGGEFRGLSLKEVARMCLERAGVRTAGMDPMRMVGEAFVYRSAYNGTSDFAVILENVMHKTLLGAFAITPDTWSRFCHVGSVSDFRAHNRYRLGTFGTLDALNEHGEFQNKQVPDGRKESITAGTKGNIIGLTRQAIINDDMGAFNGLATALGRAAALSIEADVYAALALNSGLGPTMSDGNPLFHARTGASNITNGAALTAAAIDLDRQAMASIKDLSGNEYLALSPAVLLVPLSLGSTARTINASEYDPDTVANKSQLKPNSVNGLFRDIVDTPRLSGTRRYLFADPNVAPVLEVAFLNGQQSPVLENMDGWRMDGVEMKVRIDYGVDAIDYVGAVTNAGQ